MLALKLSLVPFFLLVVSMSGKWWGPAIAGWLAGLPVVAGPILFLLVLDNGPHFGVKAATLSLSAILASEAFNFAYAWSCRSRRWPTALTLALGTWLIVAAGLAQLPESPIWALGSALIAVILGQAFLPRSSAKAISSTLTHLDVICRMVAGTALTFTAITLSAVVGPTWSGLLAVFPILGIVLCVSSHQTQGPEVVISLLRGMVLGRFSFAAFCLGLIYALPSQPIAVAFIGSATLSLLVQWATKQLAKTQLTRVNAALISPDTPD